MKTCFDSDGETIGNLTADSLVPANGEGAWKWQFVFGTPAEGWQNGPLADAISFVPDRGIDLSSLCQEKTIPNESEGTVYLTLNYKRAGIAMLGVGVDWWFEMACNGQFVASTFDEGNVFPLIMPSNHRVFFRVKEGNNLLAFHVKRGTASWQFTCASVPFELPPLPVITAGPWLSHPDAGKMTVYFRTKGYVGCGVRIRKHGETAWTPVWQHRHGQITKRLFHAIHLSGLRPGEKYDYQAIAISPEQYCLVPMGEIFTFRVPDMETRKFSVFFTADLQFGLDVQDQYLAAMTAAADASTCDMIVLGGDVNSSFVPEAVIDGPMTRLQDCGSSHIPVLYMRGNHELRESSHEAFLDYFGTPEGVTYNLFRLGDTAFLMLDSWEDKPADTPAHPYCKWNLDECFFDEETQWLKNAMEDPKWTTARRHVVLCHGAVYSHYDSCHTLQYRLQKMTDEYFGGLSPKHHVDIWLTGHVHRYIRSIPCTNRRVSDEALQPPLISGENYTYPVYTVSGPNAHSPIQASCFRVDFLEDGSMHIRSWDQDGILLEDLTIADGKTTAFKSLPEWE